MVRHVVLFSWKDGTGPDKIRDIEQSFAGLAGKIDLIEGFEWGTDISVENIAHGFTHCFLVTFKTKEDRDTYLPHPEHRKFVEMIKPYLNDALVIDYQAK
ncbi:MAG: Dabb family protein [Spirochaetales bacterium]|nr:MAG: Dabb family protein [Spirochaetales bacterium]